MATELIRQTMFKSGEVDPMNYHRTDFQDYLIAAQSLLNIEVGTVKPSHNWRSHNWKI